MGNFDNDPRRKQELLGRPLADAIYRDVFDVADIVRFDRDEDKLLDIRYAIDVQLVMKNGMVLLGQEKYLSAKYAKFNSVTIEYYQDPQIKEPGDWFKLACQFYFVSYYTDDMQSFEKWVLLNWPAVVEQTTMGYIPWNDNTNKNGRARASFRWVNMDMIPSRCLFGKSSTR